MRGRPRSHHGVAGERGQNEDLLPVLRDVGDRCLRAIPVELTGAQQPAPPTTTALYEGALLIPGDGSAPVANAAFLVQDGAIVRVGARGTVTAPAGAVRIDLSGKTVMPALINTHGHPGFQKGLTYGRQNYTRDAYLDDLNRAAYYGVRVVMSQGIDPGDLAYELRRDQETGRADGARLLIAGRGSEPRMRVRAPPHTRASPTK